MNQESFVHNELQEQEYISIDQEKPVNSETIKRNKEIIEDVFIKEYQELGFNILNEIPTFPSPDPTVMFMGAQISYWKKFLDDPVINYANPQNCIRLQNSKLFYNDEALRFCSSFRTEGAISNVHTFKEMLDSATNYLLHLGVEPSRLVIKTNDELKSMIGESEYVVYNNSEQPNYYNWTYGDQNLSGLGLTLAIKNKESGEPYDIGNVIQMYYNGEPKAIEWGFGQETLMTAIYSEDSPIKFADMPDEYRGLLSDKNNYKLIDGLLTVCDIVKQGVTPGKTGARKMCKEYVQGTAFQFNARDINRRQAIEIISSVAEHKGVDQEKEDLISNQVEHYMGRINYADVICHRNSDIDEELLSKRTSLSAEAIKAIKERIKSEQ